MRFSFWGVIVLSLTACLGMPKQVEPVKGFDVSRYMGTWYEIARLDHSFERGLENITAEYTLQPDGTVSVLNRGYNAKKGKWEQAEGKAKFVEDKDLGYLKVSFFGPFYGSYVVFDLDHQGYEFAFVSGPDHDYLWLLSRTPKVDEGLIERFKTTAQAKGFDTSELIFVDHTKGAQVK